MPQDDADSILASVPSLKTPQSPKKKSPSHTLDQEADAILAKVPKLPPSAASRLASTVGRGLRYAGRMAKAAPGALAGIAEEQAKDILSIGGAYPKETAIVPGGVGIGPLVAGQLVQHIKDPRTGRPIMTREEMTRRAPLGLATLGGMALAGPVEAAVTSRLGGGAARSLLARTAGGAAGGAAFQSPTSAVRYARGEIPLTEAAKEVGAVGLVGAGLPVAARGLQKIAQRVSPAARLAREFDVVTGERYRAQRPGARARVQPKADDVGDLLKRFKESQAAKAAAAKAAKAAKKVAKKGPAVAPPVAEEAAVSQPLPPPPPPPAPGVGGPTEEAALRRPPQPRPPAAPVEVRRDPEAIVRQQMQAEANRRIDAETARMRQAIRLRAVERGGIPEVTPLPDMPQEAQPVPPPVRQRAEGRPINMPPVTETAVPSTQTEAAAMRERATRGFPVPPPAPVAAEAPAGPPPTALNRGETVFLRSQRDIPLTVERVGQNTITATAPNGARVTAPVERFFIRDLAEKIEARIPQAAAPETVGEPIPAASPEVPAVAPPPRPRPPEAAGRIPLTGEESGAAPAPPTIAQEAPGATVVPEGPPALPAGGITPQSQPQATQQGLFDRLLKEEAGQLDFGEFIHVMKTPGPARAAMRTAGGAIVGAAAPADTPEKRLQNMTIGALIAFGGPEGVRFAMRQLGREAESDIQPFFDFFTHSKGVIEQLGTPERNPGSQTAQAFASQGGVGNFVKQVFVKDLRESEQEASRFIHDLINAHVEQLPARAIRRLRDGGARILNEGYRMQSVGGVNVQVPVTVAQLAQEIGADPVALQAVKDAYQQLSKAFADSAGIEWIENYHPRIVDDVNLGNIMGDATERARFTQQMSDYAPHEWATPAHAEQALSIWAKTLADAAKQQRTSIHARPYYGRLQFQRFLMNLPDHFVDARGNIKTLIHDVDSLEEMRNSIRDSVKALKLWDSFGRNGETLKQLTDDLTAPGGLPSKDAKGIHSVMKSWFSGNLGEPLDEFLWVIDHGNWRGWMGRGSSAIRNVTAKMYLGPGSPLKHGLFDPAAKLYGRVSVPNIIEGLLRVGYDGMLNLMTKTESDMMRITRESGALAGSERTLLSRLQLKGQIGRTARALNPSSFIRKSDLGWRHVGAYANIFHANGLLKAAQQGSQFALDQLAEKGVQDINHALTTGSFLESDLRNIAQHGGNLISRADAMNTPVFANTDIGKVMWIFHRLPFTQMKNMKDTLVRGIQMMPRNPVAGTSTIAKTLSGYLAGVLLYAEARRMIRGETAPEDWSERLKLDMEELPREIISFSPIGIGGAGAVGSPAGLEREIAPIGLAESVEKVGQHMVTGKGLQPSDIRTLALSLNPILGIGSMIGPRLAPTKKELLRRAAAGYAR